MKKMMALLLAVALLLSLTACGGAEKVSMKKEGIAPYELSEREQYLLDSFGMSNTAQIISFNAPKEAISLNVHVYRLSAAGEWEEYSGGGISIGEERVPVDTLSGVFTMELTENFGMDFHLNSAGQLSFKGDEIALAKDIVVSGKGFLQEFQEIELNREIPVALMVYSSGTSMRSYSLQDFYTPSNFDGMDLVQMVTLEFTDKEL